MHLIIMKISLAIILVISFTFSVNSFYILDYYTNDFDSLIDREIYNYRSNFLFLNDEDSDLLQLKIAIYMMDTYNYLIVK